jgi:translation initiation factor 3 subunit H
MYKEEGFTPDALRNLKVGYESLFIEIPVVIKNSTLSNILLNQVSDMVQEEDGLGFLDLGTS